ncbi:MAG: cellobiose phosphorylase [Lachnospiraceae bacterium]|nr:cellobiose phosphorylase [Lachnospiraceae bacterium]
METYRFDTKTESFTLDNPESTSSLYFPIAGEKGLKSCVTPTLSGDAKLDQNHFLLQPMSVEDLSNSRNIRSFWCRMKDGRVWCATGGSAESRYREAMGEGDEVTLSAGYMWQEMSRRWREGPLSAKVLSFVPVSEPQVECHRVIITNHSQEGVSFTSIAAIPIYGRSADNLRDHRHVTGLLHRMEILEKAVTVTPTLSFDERGHQKNHHTYYVCGVQGDGEAPEGFYPTVAEFVGEGGSFDAPNAVYGNLSGCKAGEIREGEEAACALRFKEITLQPGEAVEYLLFAGVCQEKKQIGSVLSNLGSGESVQKAYDETHLFWQEKVNIRIHTGDEKFNHFMRWVAFQPILRRIYGCSFLPHHDYGKGGRGYRDLWQDCLALLLLSPENVRELLYSNFGGVRMDGTNATIIGEKPGEFVADRNNICRVWMDHGLWPLLTTAQYIHQTGDVAFLLRENSYFKDQQACRGTAVDELFDFSKEPVQKTEAGEIYRGTILEHLLVQLITVFYEVGEHNHMRLRGADWNDALDMARERGESVAFTAAYAGNFEILGQLIEGLEKTGISSVELAEEILPLLVDNVALYEDIRGKVKLLQDYTESCKYTITGRKVSVPLTELKRSLCGKGKWIKDHIRKTELLTVGENRWFNSYYDNNGRAVEGLHGENLRMMLTGQVFTIMSGTATTEQISEICKSADAYLYEAKKGGYKLNTDFKELKTDLGRMFGFAYGHKENGAVFSHMTTMYGNALYQRGFAREGYKALNTLYQGASDFETSRIYPGIPEYFDGKGRGLYHYLTGAASWYLLTIVQEVFGIKGHLGAMVLEPRLLKEQFDEKGEAFISLGFGGKRFKITYQNPKKKDFGEYKISEVKVNGQAASFGGTEVLSVEQIAALDGCKVQEICVTLS